jgi:hypothetical protein
MSNERLVGALRERIPALPASGMRKSLSDNFYYLRVAVESAVAALDDRLAPGALPFHTFAVYLKNISQGRTNEERIIASREHIDR